MPIVKVYAWQLQDMNHEVALSKRRPRNRNHHFVPVCYPDYFLPYFTKTSHYSIFYTICFLHNQNANKTLQGINGS